MIIDTDSITEKSNKGWISLLKGINSFKKTNQTPTDAYQNMISLHCKTDGIVTDLIHEMLQKEDLFELNTKHSIFPNYDKASLNKHHKNINSNSFSIFDEKIPDSLLLQVHEFALSHPCRVDGHRDKEIIFEPENCLTGAHRFDEKKLVETELFQQLMTEPLFVNMASTYLQCTPTLCSVNLWWSPASKGSPSSESAQLYHFDMSRAKWINVFIYITDVDTESGPHCVVKGSHKIDGKRQKLLNRGYARISDEEMNEVYGSEEIKELTGQAGTIIFEDTKAFHKGKKPTKDNRLIFELSFASSLFGGEYQNIEIPEHLLNPDVKKVLSEQRDIYSRYEIS
tara:strand:- start:6213 stop:7232 length:1020 start_codon:yes stop_codon:yes gene_type:complete